MPLEAVKLTASFKLNGSIPEGLFSSREGMKVNARPKRKISIVGASLIKKFIYSAQNKIL
jgi:hypothetical protein